MTGSGPRPLWTRPRRCSRPRAAREQRGRAGRAAMPLRFRTSRFRTSRFRTLRLRPARCPAIAATAPTTTVPRWAPQPRADYRQLLMKAAVAVRATTEFRGLTAPSSALVVHRDCRFPARRRPGSRPSRSPQPSSPPAPAAATWGNVARDEFLREGGRLVSPFSFRVRGVPTAVSHEAATREMDGHAGRRRRSAFGTGTRRRQVQKRGLPRLPDLPDHRHRARSHRARAASPPRPTVREAHQHGIVRTARRMSSSLGLAYTVVVSTLLCRACRCTSRMSRVAR